MKSTLTLFMVLALGASSLDAQHSNSAYQAESPEAQAAYDAVVAFFDGMHAKDTAAISAVLTDNARLVSAAAGPDGSPRMGETPMSAFLESIGSASVSLEEPIWDPVILVSDRLATVWVKYAFYADDQFSHCGVDAFQLFLSADGWKIFQVADTRRRQDCWEPPA